MVGDETNEKSLNKLTNEEQYMNKKAQVVETIGALVIIIGSIVGGIEITKEVSQPDYVGDKSTYDLYEFCCTSRIQNISIENRIPFMTLNQAKEKGFTLRECK